MLGPGGTDSQECDIYIVTQTLIPARPLFIGKQLLLLSHTKIPYSIMSLVSDSLGVQTPGFFVPYMDFSFTFLPINPKF